MCFLVAPRVSRVPLYSTQVDIVDKGEAIKGTSLEQADMVKQTGQHEVTNEESLDDLSDTMQIEIVGKVPKHSLVCVVAASKDTTEVDNTDEAREEDSIP